MECISSFHFFLLFGDASLGIWIEKDECAGEAALPCLLMSSWMAAEPPLQALCHSTARRQALLEDVSQPLQEPESCYSVEQAR